MPLRVSPWASPPRAGPEGEIDRHPRGALGVVRRVGPGVAEQAVGAAAAAEHVVAAVAAQDIGAAVPGQLVATDIGAGEFSMPFRESSWASPPEPMPAARSTVTAAALS